MRSRARPRWAPVTEPAAAPANAAAPAWRARLVQRVRRQARRILERWSSAAPRRCVAGRRRWCGRLRRARTRAGALSGQRQPQRIRGPAAAQRGGPGRRAHSIGRAGHRAGLARPPPRDRAVRGCSASTSGRTPRWPSRPRWSRAADVVFVMEVAQLVDDDAALLQARAARRSCSRRLAPDVPMDIPDPAGKPDAEVDACLDRVARARDADDRVFVRRASASHDDRDERRRCGGPTTVLHLSSSSGPGGAETVVASVAAGLDPARYRSVVCLFRDGWLRERCERLGLQTHVLRMHGMLDLGWLRQFTGLLRDRQVAVDPRPRVRREHVGHDGRPAGPASRRGDGARPQLLRGLPRGGGWPTGS